jgi:hypothetical protein
VSKAVAAARAAMMFIRVAAWLAVLTIIVLSVVPGNLRPHVLCNDYFEHLAAYFIAGGLLAVGFPSPMQQLASWSLLATCAGVLELLQRSIPDRTASIGEFVTGVFGAGLGIMAIFVIRQALGRTSALSP